MSSNRTDSYTLEFPDPKTKGQKVLMHYTRAGASVVHEYLDDAEKLGFFPLVSKHEKGASWALRKKTQELEFFEMSVRGLRRRCLRFASVSGCPERPQHRPDNSYLGRLSV